MSTLKKGIGEFKLSDSDHSIGSFFSVDDLLSIFNIDISKRQCVVESLHKEGIISHTSQTLIDEKDLYGAFKYLIKAFSKDKFINQSSLDEYILFAILKKCYPNAICKRQYSVRLKNNNKPLKIDFYINNGNQELFIQVSHVDFTPLFVGLPDLLIS